MYRRRRRRSREIAFSLDSFLDVITNLIGIIIRMILVVWVGARSYHEVQSRLQLAQADLPATVQQAKDTQPITDPLEQELLKHRQQLEQAQENLLSHLRQLPPLTKTQQIAQQQLAGLAGQQQSLQQNNAQLQQVLAQHAQTTQAAQVSLAEVNQRSEKLRKAIAQLSQLPVAKKTIQYRTPVSRPVETEEIFFECQNGRVTFLDLTALRHEMVEDVLAKKAELKEARKLEGVTRFVGAFRLRYAIDYQQPLVGDGNVSAAGSVEPQAAPRGETVAEAFQPNSEFRQLVDFVDANQSVITFWVYPDSFAQFRQLRDYLYQRDLEVAARPLPFGHPIGFSPTGSASRSQ